MLDPWVRVLSVLLVICICNTPARRNWLIKHAFSKKKKMIAAHRIAVFFVCFCLATFAEAQDPASKAKAMLARMTLPEKIQMLHGFDGGYVGNVQPNTRLGIPVLNLNDGKQLRQEKIAHYSTW